jgi:hypothetical protein
MAKFIMYPVDLKCPACKRKGEADAQEFYGGGRYTLTCVTDGFVLMNGSRIVGNAIILCPCGAEFNA